MNAKQFKRCLDDLLRSFGGYEREEGLPPAPDGRHHLDIGHENFVALLASLRWSMQNIADFDGTEEPNNESSSAVQVNSKVTPTKREKNRGNANDTHDG